MTPEGDTDAHRGAKSNGKYSQVGKCVVFNLCTLKDILKLLFLKRYGGGEPKWWHE